MKHLFHEYFIGGAQWICAPRPLILDNSFDYTHEQLKNIELEPQSNYLDYGIEIMFDAANCLKMGRHILMNVSNENQRLGLKWLKSILGSEYTVWDINITDSHIDSTFLPIRPGLGIVTDDTKIDTLPPEIQKWELIYIPTTSQNIYKCKDPLLASPKIMLNFLSVSPDCIICHDGYVNTLQRKLKCYNIDVIPSRMRHTRLFSGGHHCVTLDINRTGNLENYFD